MLLSLLLREQTSENDRNMLRKDRWILRRLIPENHGTIWTKLKLQMVPRRWSTWSSFCLPRHWKWHKKARNRNKSKKNENKFRCILFPGESTDCYPQGYTVRKISFLVGNEEMDIQRGTILKLLISKKLNAWMDIL